MSRLPISVRLAVLSTASLIALLALLGGAVYHQLGTSLRAGVDQQLVDLAAALPPGLDQGDLDVPADEELGGVELSDRLVQVVDASGRVLGASDDVEVDRPLLGPASLRQARSGTPVLATVSQNEDPEDRLRVLGVRYGGAGLVAIVAAELDEVDDAQQALLAVYGPVSLAGSALAGAIGYLITRRALAPVRQMTAEAEAISGSDLSRRLSPPARLDEVGRLTRTLNGMLARLDAAIGRERAFAADASHELRTPLAILTAEVELVRDRVDNTSRSALDTVLDEAARLSGLVDDLLLLARADAGQLDDHRPIDLDELVDGVTGRFATLATRRGVQLTSTGAAVVRGDVSGLERAVGNLVDNALRHTPEGGLVSVEIRPTQPVGADIVVSDTGPGVPPGRLHSLFDRFSRVDSARHEPGGAGLGLAIVAAVAAAHCGTVTAANRGGGGLSVVLALRK